MKRGRITKEEQIYRFKQLVKFIFTFRYVTRPQHEIFARI